MIPDLLICIFTYHHYITFSPINKASLKTLLKLTQNSLKTQNIVSQFFKCDTTLPLGLYNHHGSHSPVPLLPVD